MLKALTLEVPEGTEGKVSFPEDLLGSALEGTLVSWAEIGYRFRSQSPLFVLAIFKNCLQINDVATEITGKVLFPQKELTWRNWRHRKALKSSTVKENQRVFILRVSAMNPGKDWAGRQICRRHSL